MSALALSEEGILAGTIAKIREVAKDLAHSYGEGIFIQIEPEAGENLPSPVKMPALSVASAPFESLNLILTASSTRRVRVTALFE